MNASIPGKTADIRPEQQVPLVSWIWRSYFRTSLIPLLIVEVALIAIYFASNTISNRANIQAVRTQAEAAVTQTAQREASGINRQLEGITRATDYLRYETGIVMTGKAHHGLDDPGRFAYSKEGVFYTTRDTGGSALFYSGIIPVGSAEREKAYRSAGLDHSYIGIKNAFPLIVQVYYNTFDSLNRIYPYFDVLSQYAPKMDIPSFNFYYEADLKHNPQRKVVWTDVYVDPAGQGWLTSCIAPVYRGDFLEGVVGTDVTVNTIIRDVLDLKIPWNGYGLLISRSGTIIALPKGGEADWGVREFTSHQYSEAVQKEIFKPLEFNLFERGKNLDLSKALRVNPSGLMHADLDTPSIVAWATIPETGWKLLVTVPEDKVFAPAQSLASRLNTLAWLMVGGMLVFYMIFFSVLFRRARQMSEHVSQPLERIDAMVKSVAAGQYLQEAPEFQVTELSQTAQGIVRMGNQLDSSSKSREAAEQALRAFARQLQSVFDLSPDGFVSTADDGAVVLVNPAFCRMIGTESSQVQGLKESLLWQQVARKMKNPAPDLGQQQSFQLELEQPRKRVLQCEIRSINPENASSFARVIYFHDMTREYEVDRMKSQFITTAAHELRTPLTGVMGYAELLLNNMLPEEMRPKALGIIVDQSKWLVKIINDLLELTRIESGRTVLEIGRMSLGSIAEAALSEFVIPEGRDPVVYESGAHLEAEVDKERLKKVVLILLDNAYKYSYSGQVALRVVQRVAESRLEVGIEVEDAGIGIGDEDIPRVFERFWRADTTGSIPGTGLGMSIATEIMRLLGGKVEIRSIAGKGTTVTLWIPQAGLQGGAG